MNYECHITVDRDDGPVAAGVAEGFVGVKYSQIDGDPVLGKKVFAYLTFHDAAFIRTHHRMLDIKDALRRQGVTSVREKIELIIYDTKTGVGV